MNIYAKSDNEISVLRTIRSGLIEDGFERRDKRDFPELFHSKDDRQLVDTIESREEVDFQGLVNEFKENGELLNLSVHVASSFEDAAGTIKDIAENKDPEFGDVKHIIQHSHEDVQSLQLWSVLENSPISLHTTYNEDKEVKDKTLKSYIGITAADWGVAESATLLQLTAPGRPRSTSLVPSIHIGIVRRSKVLATLAEAYSMLRRQEIPDSFVFISGPSKTADIEAHMVHGAHGPREMHVIIVED